MLVRSVGAVTARVTYLRSRSAGRQAVRAPLAFFAAQGAGLGARAVRQGFDVLRTRVQLGGTRPEARHDGLRAGGCAATVARV